MQITTIGLDLAKNVFQVHGIDATEKVVVRKQLRRGQLIKFFEARSSFSDCPRLMWWTTPAPGIECHRVVRRRRIT